MSLTNQNEGIEILQRTTQSTEETIAIAERFAQSLRAGDVVLVSGPIGAGKTYFVKGLAAGLGVIDMSEVNSPTFDIVHAFEGRMTIYHMDLYRIEEVSEDDLEWIREHLQEQAVCVIEWGERIAHAVDPPYYHVQLDFADGENSRLISIVKKARKSGTAPP